MKAAIARVAQPVGGLHLKKTLAFNSQIQRIAGLLKRALAQVEPVAAQQPVVVHRPP